jgi:hypothetical protein
MTSQRSCCFLMKDLPMTTLVRVLPPIDARYQTTTANGRSYTAAPGAALDVLDFDAAVITANSWLRVGRSSTTATRPTDPRLGELILDSTLAKMICWDGAHWRDPATGSAV